MGGDGPTATEVEVEAEGECVVVEGAVGGRAARACADARRGGRTDALRVTGTEGAAVG